MLHKPTKQKKRSINLILSKRADENLARETRLTDSINVLCHGDLLRSADSLKLNNIRVPTDFFLDSDFPLIRDIKEKLLERIRVSGFRCNPYPLLTTYSIRYLLFECLEFICLLKRIFSLEDDCSDSVTIFLGGNYIYEEISFVFFCIHYSGLFHVDKPINYVWLDSRTSRRFDHPESLICYLYQLFEISLQDFYDDLSKDSDSLRRMTRHLKDKTVSICWVGGLRYPDNWMAYLQSNLNMSVDSFGDKEAEILAITTKDLGYWGVHRKNLYELQSSPTLFVCASLPDHFSLASMRSCAPELMCLDSDDFSYEVEIVESFFKDLYIPLLDEAVQKLDSTFLLSLQKINVGSFYAVDIAEPGLMALMSCCYRLGKIPVLLPHSFYACHYQFDQDKYDYAYTFMSTSIICSNFSSDPIVSRNFLAKEKVMSLQELVSSRIPASHTCLFSTFMTFLRKVRRKTSSMRLAFFSCGNIFSSPLNFMLRLRGDKYSAGDALRELFRHVNFKNSGLQSSPAYIGLVLESEQYRFMNTQSVFELLALIDDIDDCLAQRLNVSSSPRLLLRVKPKTVYTSADFLSKLYFRKKSSAQYRKLADEFLFERNDTTLEEFSEKVEFVLIDQLGSATLQFFLAGVPCVRIAQRERPDKLSEDPFFLPADVLPELSIQQAIQRYMTNVRWFSQLALKQQSWAKLQLHDVSIRA
jgi:hypothetical protein